MLLVMANQNFDVFIFMPEQFVKPIGNGILQRNACGYHFSGLSNFSWRCVSGRCRLIATDEPYPGRSRL